MQPDVPQLVLASQSPRRRELLAILGIPFSVIPAAIDETPRAGEEPEAFAVRVAREKGHVVASQLDDSLVLAADTIVTIDGDILNKPVDRDDAVRMLHKLSGRMHYVITAICLINQRTKRLLEGVDRTEVWFAPLTDVQIQDYLQREDVFDKAGAYAIQGYAGIFIPRIHGNYFNVMGLPLPLVHHLLCQTLS